MEGTEIPQVYLGINDKDEPPLRLVRLAEDWYKAWRIEKGQHRGLSADAISMERGRQRLEIRSREPSAGGSFFT